LAAKWRITNTAQRARMEEQKIEKSNNQIIKKLHDYIEHILCKRMLLTKQKKR
jgi:hypothetical protein